MLRILLGRARTGKSARVLEEIRALGDSSQQILLVPEHASHVAEVDVCRACGPTASRHAEVLTFKLLASRVLTLTGGAAEVTPEHGGHIPHRPHCDRKADTRNKRQVKPLLYCITNHVLISSPF